MTRFRSRRSNAPNGLYFLKQQPIATILRINIMFAISPQPMIFTFQPSRPSPLSPRQTNACHRTRPLHSHMASAKEACTSTHHKRENKFKTLIKSKDTERSQRRELFLKKVKQVGDDRKWEARGDQVRCTHRFLETALDFMLISSRC